MCCKMDRVDKKKIIVETEMYHDIFCYNLYLIQTNAPNLNNPVVQIRPYF